MNERMNHIMNQGLNVLDSFSDYLAKGWFIHPGTMKLTPPQLAIDPSRLWVYVNPDSTMKCNFYQDFFKRLGFIHSRCLDCWKVCVQPQNVEQLFEVYTWQEQWSRKAKNGRFCKCGVESRDNVTNKYGAYFYCGSKEQGLNRLDEVRQSMEPLNANIPIFLKRYCTEFEQATGPSDQYVSPAVSFGIEKEVMAAFDLSSVVQTKQPRFLVEQIQSRWLAMANRIDGGINGKPLFNECKRYERG